jgi:hypothetical protein
MAFLECDLIYAYDRQLFDFIPVCSRLDKSLNRSQNNIVYSPLFPRGIRIVLR